jgi:hypothetical protein
MKIVFSALNIEPKDYNIIASMAKISNFLVQSHGYETVFFCENKLYKIFKDIPYNNVQFFEDRIIKEIPKTYWSLGKLLALGSMNEASLHIDMDLFIFKKFDESIINNEIVCYHPEQWNHYLVECLYDFFIKPEKTIGITPRSYNSAIIGGTNFRLIKDCIDEIFKYFFDNIEELTKLARQNEKFKNQYSHVDGGFIPTMLIEQVWLYQLFKFYNKEITCYIKDSNFLVDTGLQQGMFHIWGEKGLNGLKEIIIKYSEYGLQENYNDIKFDFKYLNDFINS